MLTEQFALEVGEKFKSVFFGLQAPYDQYLINELALKIELKKYGVALPTEKIENL